VNGLNVGEKWVKGNVACMRVLELSRPLYSLDLLSTDGVEDNHD